MTRRLARPVGITATGQHYPENRVTNDDLSKVMETNDEWIRNRTGIGSRHWVEKGVGASDLAAPALQMALDQRGMKADELEVIIVATVTPDTFFPATAFTSIVKARPGSHATTMSIPFLFPRVRMACKRRRYNADNTKNSEAGLVE